MIQKHIEMLLQLQLCGWNYNLKFLLSLMGVLIIAHMLLGFVNKCVIIIFSSKKFIGPSEGRGTAEQT